MKKILKISWRNIWRNKIRSSIIIIAIIIGIMGGIFSGAIRLAAEKQQFEEAVDNRTSHIQVHHPKFVANPEARFYIKNGIHIAKEIEAIDGVHSVSERSVVEGMVASANLNAGVRIKGVDALAEALTTNLNSLITEGTYFENEGRLPSIIIGEALANTINVSVGSRIVLTFQDIKGEMISASFVVEGLYKLSSRRFEESTVFIQSKNIYDLIGKEKHVTEIAVVIDDVDNYRLMAEKIRKAFPELDVKHWADMEPSLYYSLEFLNQNLIWMVGIIILGVSFGLFNTILMSVLERVKEFGILMAIGMKRTKVFLMIIFETIMLSFIAGVSGLILSYGMIRHFKVKGINLEGVGAEGLEDFGYATVLYLDLDPQMYFQIGIMVMVFAVLAAVYPAVKAIRLSPVEAVRSE